MSLGKGSVSSFSTQKIINRKRFTEDDLIGVEYAMNKILLSR